MSALTATCWLLFRTFVGLDFSDEMQYYGEISSLVHTGRFFQNDLFVQQLGYFWLFPLFKLHASLFPEGDYLILFGRGVLFTAYGVAGLVFWRAAHRLGFSALARLTGLAMLLAWIPFQLFAPSYNTMSYLLIVCLVAAWMTREGRPFLSAVVMAALLIALAVVYPPAGLVLGFLFLADTFVRQGLRPALLLLALTAVGGAMTVAALVALHGSGFLTDLRTALEFSSSFGVAKAIRHPSEFAGLIALLAANGAFIWRLTRGAPIRHLEGAGDSRLSRNGVFALFVAIGLIALGVVLGVIVLAGRNSFGIGYGEPLLRLARYAAIACFGVLLILLTVSIRQSIGHPATESHARVSEGTASRAHLTMFASSCAVLFALSITWTTGFFAAAICTLVTLALATSATRGGDGRTLVELVIIGAVLGAVYAGTSGNGLHNFGVGSAGVVPFLVLFGIRKLEDLSPFRLPAIVQQGALPLLVFLVLINGLRFPYREKPGVTGFLPVRGIPAFKGLHVSSNKIEAINLFSQLYAPGTLAGKRVLVTGPHPWFYFMSRCVPATPMFFMHFDRNPTADEFLARHLFRSGQPEAILITTPLPSPVEATVARWIDDGCVTRTIKLPSEFTLNYERQTSYKLADELQLLIRDSKKP